MPSIQPPRPAILAIDDSPTNLIALNAVIRALDVDFVEARSGSEALALCAQRRFALIILDLMMPGMDGFEALERLRLLPDVAHTPILYLSARDLDNYVMTRAFGLGAVDFLVKPIDPDLLRGKVASLVALFMQADEQRRQSSALRAKLRQVESLVQALRAPLDELNTAVTTESSEAQRSRERIAAAVAQLNTVAENLLEQASEAHAESAASER